MRKFLRLTNNIINTNYITYINRKNPNQFEIHIMEPQSISGFAAMGSGFFSSDNTNYFTINKPSDDYDIVTKFIEELE